MYPLLRQFRDAPPQEREIAFTRMSEAWIAIQRGHNIWRIIKPILDATGEIADQAAFMNILPFRTRMDAPAPAAVLRAVWQQSSGGQIAALAPKRIIALGKKAWNVLSRFELPAETKLILFKRGIGDSYIPHESKAVLAALAAER